jgi:hypothetical protein
MLTGDQYSDETAKTLAEELLRGADGKKTIAVVSAPSVFVQLKNLLVSYLREGVRVCESRIDRRQAESGKNATEKPRLYLLEFDRRFEVFPEFVYFDFNDPLSLPRK